MLKRSGKSGIVTRPNHVKVKAFNEDMEPIELEGEELLARAFCHEIDHLDGHLYVELAKDGIHDVEYRGGLRISFHGYAGFFGGNTGSAYRGRA